jgi:hypothetical protein
MKKLKPHSKVIIVIVIILCSWLLFPFFTYGVKNILYVIPLVILITQIILSILFKNRKLLMLTLLNPVAFFAIFYTVKSTANYINGTPTIILCCYYRPAVPSFNQNKSVYWDYYDDDCDWEELYYYTLDINNYVTNELITLFGNPIWHKHNDGAHNNK